MRAETWMCIAVLAGCARGSAGIEVQGVARDGPRGDGLPGVEVTALSRALVELDRTTSGEGGWYRLVLADQADFVHVTLSGEGLRTTSFGGEPGLNPRIRVPNGQSIALTDTRWDELLETWEGCPGLGERGAIYGTVQIADVVAEDGDPLPITTGDLRVELPDQTVKRACYLGESGVYDPEADVTGERATFLIPDLPSATLRVSLSWRPVDTQTEVVDYAIWVPEDGVATTFPLLVDSPFQIEP